MSNSIIAEGKTTAEAVQNGLNILKVSKDKVNIKVLENEDKRSFFSILAPRVVKVELTVKEDIAEVKKEQKEQKEYNPEKESVEKALKNTKKFIKEFIEKLDKGLEYTVEEKENCIIVDIKGKDAGCLIGYRGDSLNALQNVISSVANKDTNTRIKVILDIEEYRKKREKVLEELAVKISKTVNKTGKSVTLEPMTPFERKVIHSKLQDDKNVRTYSIGENDNRRVVIEKI